MEVIANSAERNRRFLAVVDFALPRCTCLMQLKPSSITMPWHANRDVLCCCFMWALLLVFSSICYNVTFK